MRSSFDKAFELTIGLEGALTNDPRDPGGFTIYGLSAKYNPGVSPITTLEDAKKIYLERYWIPAGCDEAPFPMDICLFDSQVNPQNDPKWNGGGNQEIKNLKPENWQEYMLFRMVRYMRNSKPEYKLGHIQRVLRLFAQIREL
jgi:hypothetical protein